MIDIKVNKDASEIIPYDQDGIPIYIQRNHLSSYPNYEALCHWHEDIEFIHILDGQMHYYIDGKCILLKKNDSLMVNAGRLHYGYSLDKSECIFYCIILHPALITANSLLHKKYIETVTLNSGINYLLFHDDVDINASMHAFYHLKTHPSSTYELDVIQHFHRLWQKIYKIGSVQYQDTIPTIDDDILVQRQMVSYIYQNYSYNITLDDIAASGKICKSKCCQIFKKYVGHSPMDFVSSYRLEHSLKLLSTTSLSITEVGTACGFNNPSYYSKQFQNKYGCTPREYRKKHQEITTT